MPVPTGTASLLDIQNEFGGSNPISLSEYYGAADGVPSSGAISINVFRGKSAISYFYNTISSNTQELNLYTYLINQGWNGVDAVVFTIASGVYIWSDNTSVAALDTVGNYPNGLEIINNGFIIGKGGNGAGASVSTPTPGGPAINLSTPVSINNIGYIGGGGGGGHYFKRGDPADISGGVATSGGGGGAGGGKGGNSRGGEFAQYVTQLAVGSAGAGVGQDNLPPDHVSTSTSGVTIYEPSGEQYAQPTGAGGAGGVACTRGS